MSLKQKTISGLMWSFIDMIASQGLTFVVGVILARLLSPREFGLIGMITVFIAISTSFINSGFSNALIRKRNCTEIDYSTVFFFNLAVGVIFFLILFFSAPAIAAFFKEPALKAIVQVLGLVLVIDSLSIIQKTILTKQIDFKLQTRISFIASIASAIVALYMAFSGFGVWSLVGQRLSRQALTSLLLWLWNRWCPLLVFSSKSFKELFGFGSKLLVSGLIDTLYQNIYYLIIGKYFSAQDLGFYTKANEFKDLPTQGLTGIIGRVTYPVLSSIQDDKLLLKNNYKILIRSTMFFSFVLMLGMAAVAEPLIITLIGEKWRASIVYLQMMCFIGMMYPLHSLNLNMLQVQGRSDLFLKLEIIKKILAIPTIIIGVFWGIKMMIAGMMVNTLISYYLNSYWSGTKIGYPIKEQIKDIIPSFGLALTMAAFVFVLGLILPFNYLGLLTVQIAAGTVFVILFCEIFNFKDYLFIKNTAVEMLKEIKTDRYSHHL